MRKRDLPQNSERSSRCNLLRRAAKEAQQYKAHMKVLCSMLAMLSLLIGVIYLWAILYQNTGSFTVSLNKYEMMKYGLSLSESRDMQSPTSHLNAHIAEYMTNIAGSSIPDNVDMIDGAHNGENYIAYTFYLQNVGCYAISYEQTVTVTNITNHLDEAIRVQVFQNGKPTTYAKTASDGSGAEPGTVEFYSLNAVMKERIDDFQPKQVTKYTIVIWLEGNDPDCVDELIGGQLKIDMKIKILHERTSFSNK